MTSVFYILALLACPVGMGLMMLMMMRGPHPGAGAPEQAGGLPPNAEVAALRAEIEALKAAHPAGISHPGRQ